MVWDRRRLVRHHIWALILQAIPKVEVTDIVNQKLV